MNFVQEEKGYCYNNDEDHKKEIIRETSKLPFSLSSSSSSVSSSKYKPFVPHQHQNSWLLGPFDSQAAASNFDNNNNHEEPTGDISGIMYRSIEKEYMFDKIVTPSDVGKLNRLVIPKQHAERYFPLDSSSNEKGLLLNFEDRNGKAWRFRYSYWNSSQSYVMTKGWSRFVKDKKLDAGDIVLFQRGVGDLGKDRLYIDWRRRPDIVPDPTLNQLPWGTRLYSLPQFSSIPLNYDHLQRMNYNNTIHHQQQHILGSSMQYYLRPSGSQQNERGHMPMVIDSVPVKSTAAKRLRLFGVNMECPAQDDDQSSATMSSSRQAAEFANKGKSSLSFEFASKYGAN